MNYKTELIPPEEAVRVYNFIKGKNLDYPGYADWVEKCKRQLEIGEKRAIATSVNNQVIGSIVFQCLKGDNKIMEVKNFRVDENHKRLGVGSSLDHSLFNLAKSEGFRKIQIDTHSNNAEMISFLIKRGYVAQSQENLYSPNKKEIILTRDL